MLLPRTALGSQGRIRETDPAQLKKELASNESFISFVSVQLPYTAGGNIKWHIHVTARAHSAYRNYAYFGHEILKNY